jgi:hypothetical protein
MRIQSLIAAAVASVVVVALGAIAAIAASMSSSTEASGVRPVRVAVAAKALDRSCLDCGVVVAVKEIELKGRAIRRTAQYQIRVRMSDGSVKTLTSSSLPRWKAGDRVRLHNGFLAG